MNVRKLEAEIVQISNALPSGEYASIRVYDNGNSIDRYTVVFMDVEPNGISRDCVAMGSDVTSPQGFYQHCTCQLGKHLGKRIKFASLPLAHQKKIIAELRSMKGSK